MAFIWNDIILLALTFARKCPTFYSQSPNPCNSDVRLLPLGQVLMLRGVWVLGRKAVGWEVCSVLEVWIYETLPTVYILLRSDNEQLEELDVCDCILLAS